LLISTDKVTIDIYDDDGGDDDQVENGNALHVFFNVCGVVCVVSSRSLCVFLSLSLALRVSQVPCGLERWVGGRGVFLELAGFNFHERAS
jgi:hypothetical protein